MFEEGVMVKHFQEIQKTNKSWGPSLSIPDHKELTGSKTPSLWTDKFYLDNEIQIQQTNIITVGVANECPDNHILEILF